MVSIETFKQIALGLPEALELPHFEKTSFRVGKKIFATLDETTKIACLKLSIIDQNTFCLIDKNIIYPVPNKWGKQGWTFAVLSLIKKQVMTDLITTAYCEVAPKKLIAQISTKKAP